MACKLYRTMYLSDIGYIVYRHCFDETKCSVEDGARAHLKGYDVRMRSEGGGIGGLTVKMDDEGRLIMHVA